MSTDAPVPAAPTTESPTANTAPPQAPVSDTAAPLPSATSDLPESEPLTPEILEEEAQRGDFVLRWAVVLMALLYGFTHIAATHTLVLVKTGQHLLSHGVIPSGKALFSTLAEGRAWTDFAWGFEILSAAIFNASGFTGLTVAKALVAALIFGIVVHTSRKNVPSLWTSIVAAAGILATHSHFSATPNLITLLGLALVLFGVLRWRNRETETTRRGTLYWLIPMFLVWGNLDPRAYLGIALLGLYTLGTALSTLMKRGGPKPNLKHLGIVLGASLAVLVIHPSPAAPLLAPFHIYGAEYPAFRVFLGQTALPNRLEFYPAYAPGVAQSLDLGTFVAIGLLVAFILMVVLQALDADLGLVLSVLGFAGIAVMGLRELPAAALVTAVATAWMGQSWFAQSFKLDYAVTTWNIFFSRGARAVAVLGLAALAFFGGTDRLRVANSGHTGWGLDPGIQATLESLKTQLEDAPDDHPFHYTMFQGDELIWLGRKAFIDTRAGLYFGRGDDDLVTVFSQTRESLRTPKKASPLAGITTADKSVKWETILDKYKVTHAVITLEDQTFIGVPTFQSMLTMGRTGKWIVSDFGALSATLARTDVDTHELVKYRTEHTFDPVKLAFTQKAVDPNAKPDAIDLTLIPPRTSVQEPPTFYDSLWRRPKETSGPILRALNLVRLSRQNDREMPWGWHEKRDALALLGIQEAQRALEQSPPPRGTWRSAWGT